MSFTITRFFGIAREQRMSFGISSPKSSKYCVVNIEPATFSGCIYAASISRGGDSRLFPEICFEGLFLEICCEYGFDTIENVQ
jgi:hypothetical protein